MNNVINTALKKSDLHEKSYSPARRYRPHIQAINSLNHQGLRKKAAGRISSEDGLNACCGEKRCQFSDNNHKQKTVCFLVDIFKN